jgi:lipoate-protein ligase A
MTVDTMATQVCRRLPWHRATARGVLAGSEALLAVMPEHATAALRWYTPTDIALVLGAGQPLATLDLDACAQAGATVYRRLSGGTTVLLDSAVLGLDLALPPGHPLCCSDVTESYRFVGEAWERALRRLGMPATLVDVPTARAARRDDPLSRLAQLACFGSLSPYEIMVDGRKLVGLAQVRRRQGTLFQASLQYVAGVDLLAAVLQLSSVERSQVREALRRRMVGLDELTSKPAPMAVVAAAYEEELREVRLVMRETQQSAREQLVAAALYAERYRPLV